MGLNSRDKLGATVATEQNWHGLGLVALCVCPALLIPAFSMCPLASESGNVSKSHLCGIFFSLLSKSPPLCVTGCSGSMVS